MDLSKGDAGHTLGWTVPDFILFHSDHRSNSGLRRYYSLHIGWKSLLHFHDDGWSGLFLNCNWRSRLNDDVSWLEESIDTTEDIHT